MRSASPGASRSTSVLRFACIAALLSAGCAPPDVSDAEASAQANELLAAEVGVLTSGYSSRILACSGICVRENSFWVDLSVENAAYHKEVGILWSTNGWASSTLTFARFEEGLGGGRERWGVDVNLGQSLSDMPEVVYAAFVTMNGVQHWDPLNDHYIRDFVNEEHPVRLLRSSVRHDGSTVLLEGEVRVLDVAYDKNVEVRFSTDAWASFADAPAAWSSGHDWHFAIPLVGSQPLPEAVELAVHYRAAAVDAWDNNHGSNFRHVLEPVFTPDRALPNAVGGIVELGGVWRTDLPIAAVSARVDDAPFVSSTPLAFSTEALADGAHRAEFRVELVGGYAAHASVPFEVENHLASLGGWDLPQVVPENEYPWDAARGPDGALHILWSNGLVARSPAFGSTAEPFLYPAFLHADRIAVDAQARLLALDSGARTLTRVDTDGALDASFGDGGTVSLDALSLESPLCYAGYLAAAASFLVVSDTCNARLLVLDAAGALVQTLAAAPPDTYAIVFAVAFDGSILWVPMSDRVLRFPLEGAAFAAAEPLELTRPLEGAEGVALQDGKLWLAERTDRLTVVDAHTGDVEGSFLTGSGVRALPGEAPLVRALVPFADSSVGLLAASSERVVRYRLRAFFP